MLKKINKQINNKKAFTLVEALVAISILMIAIASPMTLAQKGLSTATLSKDQMIASFLAQDAIESVKNIRDQIAVSQTADWLAPVQGSVPVSLAPCVCTTDDCSFATKFCTIDTTRAWTSPIDNSGSIQAGLVSVPAPKLKISYNINAGIKQFLKYDYNNLPSCSVNSTGGCGEDSKFTRYINIKKSVTNPNEAVVNVRVSWSSAQGDQKIDIQDFIYNYSENHL